MKYLKSLFVQTTRNYSKRYQRFKTLLTPTIEENFRSSVNKIIDDVSSKKSYLSLPGVKEQIIKFAEFNTKVGKNPSGIILLHSYDVLTGTETLSQNVNQKAFVLAWATEMLHSYNMLEDHKYTIENEIKKMPGDKGLLRSSLYDTLEVKCEGHLYKNYSQLFDKGFLYSSIGNYLDHYTISKGKADTFVDFNSKTYETLCNYRTAYNTFKLPFFIVSQIEGKADNLLNNSIKKIGSDIGKLYQMQEEFEDCFGEESKSVRSSGTDIQQGKCTWLAVAALRRCTVAQRVVFNACYGSNEPAHVERIKWLYEQLKIPQLYREEEGALCESVMQTAESIESAGFPLTMFSKLLDVMYDKQKIEE